MAIDECHRQMDDTAKLFDIATIDIVANIIQGLPSPENV
jgi:hypothetical protein